MRYRAIKNDIVNKLQVIMFLVGTDNMKRMALIAPVFFGYEKIIIDKYKKIGFEVDFIPENIVESNKIYRLKFILSKDKQKNIDDYFINRFQKKYDIVLIIRGYYLSEKILNFIKTNNTEAKLYMYQWDSVKNNPNAQTVAKYCTKNSTFDIEDSNKYGWQYRPLFYISETERNCKREYDYAFICSLHSQRLKIYQEIKKIASKPFLYLFSKRTHYIKQKYLRRNKEFNGVNDKEIKFKSLSIYEANNFMGKSDIVVDYTHPDQSGFTMRTCESIGHRCKLITNNKLVIESDFYRESNVYVYDIDNFKVPDSFLESLYEDLPAEVYERYSIENWLKEVIDI